MSRPTPRRSARAFAFTALPLAVAALLLAASAVPARAGLSSWTSLSGLDAASGANWVRTYATGTPPTTIYAGTEGDGVFRSVTSGVTWAPFSSGLNAPGSKNVRTIFTSASTVYAGTEAGLFASTGGAWTPVAQGPEPDPAHPVKLNASVQAVYSVTLGGLLAGTAFHGVYRSADGGQTWTPPAPSNGMPAGETVWSLTGVGPLVFAATTSGVYRSADGGGSWSLASDGIPGVDTVLRVIADGTNPNILYAATASDGIYRSIDLGVTWSSISAGLGNSTIRGIQQFSGATTTRLYAATNDGLWTGSTGNGPLPGAVSWRHVTATGLGNATIMWAVTSFLSPPGTLLVGTQSDGGFALTFEPPSNTAPPGFLGTTQVGQTLLGINVGTWSGTPTIDYDRQWQICTSATGGCSDVDGETQLGFTIPQADQGKYVRLKITAHNDFPTPGATAPTAVSAIGGPITANPGTLPGATQQLAPSISPVAPADPALPKVGDTLRALNWLFNPAATTTSFQWLRCDVNGDNCEPIAGAKASDYVLTTADAEVRLRARVSGTNSSGSTILPDSAPSNTIIPDPATALTPPTLAGEAVVGSTLVGGVGSWKSPKTTWSRQWERCDGAGSGCSPVYGETNPGYVVQGGDVGSRLRLHVVADVNESYKLPAAVDAYTPLSAVVTVPGGGGPGPGGPAPGGPGPGGPGPGGSARDTTPPRLTKLTAKVARKGLVLGLRLSEATSLTIVVQRAGAGHVVKHRCVSGPKRHAKACTAWAKVATVTRRGLRAGATTIVLGRRVGRHRLHRGSYRLLLTARDAAGNRTVSKPITFRVR